MSDYIAGSCNIGPSEIHRRYQVAIVAGLIYLIAATAVMTTDESPLIRLTVFIPAMAASVGYTQARRKFCLAYGLAGLFNFERAGDVKKVGDKAALKADRAYALKVLTLSLFPALFMTAIVFVF
ncbi:MAG: hypothetical protein ACKOXI_04200 [Candidatus Planktophila sp.]